MEGKIENEDGEVKRDPLTVKPLDHLSAALNTLFLKSPKGLYCWYDDGSGVKTNYPKLTRKFDINQRNNLIICRQTQKKSIP